LCLTFNSNFFINKYNTYRMIFISCNYFFAICIKSKNKNSELILSKTKHFFRKMKNLFHKNLTYVNIHTMFTFNAILKGKIKIFIYIKVVITKSLICFCFSLGPSSISVFFNLFKVAEPLKDNPLKKRNLWVPLTQVGNH